MLGDCNGQAFAVMVPLKVVVDASRPRDLPVMRLIVSSLSACFVALSLASTASAASGAQQVGGVPVPPPPRGASPVAPVQTPPRNPVPAPIAVAPASPPGAVPTPAPPASTIVPGGAVVTVIPGAQTSQGATLVPQGGRAPAARAGQQAALMLEVESSGETGQIVVAIYQDAAAFRSGETPVRTLTVDRDGPVTRAWVLGMPAGRYAIAVFQDVDGDGKLARTLGMAREPSGYSNAARSRFGPPAFDLAAFDLPAGGVTQRIALR